MKKIIALLLSVILVFSLVAPASAAAEDEADVNYDGYPVVVVRGIDFSQLTYEDGTLAMQVRVKDIIDLIFDLIIGKFVLKNDNALAEAAVDFVWDFMGPIASNPDGSSVNEVSMKSYPSNMADHIESYNEFGDKGEHGVIKSVGQAIGLENTYYFTYDWRKSPEILAGELNTLIETAKEQTGKDKVHIIGCSMGGMVSTAYMYYYGHDSLDSVTFHSAANNGAYVCGDALNGNILFTPDTLSNTIKNLLGGESNIVIDILLKVAKSLGAFDLLCDFLNNFVDENAEYVYSDCLRDILATALGLWGLCPDEDFRSGVEFVFGSQEEKYASLLTQLDEVEKFVCSTEETTRAAYNDGVKISIISNYNKPLTPVNPRATMNGDGIVEAELTSSFATFAPYGEVLSDEYIATRDSKYISPDKVVDASTAEYPDSTWFIRDAGHVASGVGTEYSDFILKLILSEQQPTVYNLEGYPQFMTADKDLNLFPNTAE
ncbi:MAG: lipase family alpha/beta hydrolase [Acutalibacteraceae bacterium]